MNKINENIWIGNSNDASNKPLLKSAGITAILNCAFDLKDHLQYPEFVIAHCGLIDGPGNKWDHYLSAYTQLSALIDSGHKVLVHCHKGESRSVTVVMMYLDSKERKGWDHWRAFIKDRRDIPDHTPHEAHKAAWESNLNCIETTKD